MVRKNAPQLQSSCFFWVNENQLFVAYFFERRIIKKKMGIHASCPSGGVTKHGTASKHRSPVDKTAILLPPAMAKLIRWALRSSQKFPSVSPHEKTITVIVNLDLYFNLAKTCCLFQKMMIQNVPALLHINTINTNQLPSALREVQRGNGVFLGHSYFEHSWKWIFNLLLLQCCMCRLLCEKP